MSEEFVGGTGRHGHLGALNYGTNTIEVWIPIKAEENKEFLKKIERGEFVVRRDVDSGKSFYNTLISQISSLYHTVLGQKLSKI